MQRVLSYYRPTTRPIPAVPRRRARCAFTLIELMVVIAVIAVLFSLLGIAVMSVFGTAKTAATKATLVKIQGLLQQRVEAVTRKGPDETFVRSIQSRFGNYERAKAMARKYNFRLAFPQTWSEIETNYSSLLTGQTYPSLSNRRPATESGEVLLFILTKANVLGYPPEGVDVFSSSEIKDTDSNGAPELVDAWGKPLRFYRWPTRLVRGAAYSAAFTAADVPATARALMPALPTTTVDLRHDADDPFGMLQVNSNWRPIFPGAVPPAQIAFAESGGTNSGPFQGGPFHTLETMSLPLVLSAGPDGETGLYEPNDYPNFGHLAQPDATALNNTFDDLTNYNSRSGGK